MTTAIELIQVSKAYPDGIAARPVLTDVNLRVEAGEFVALVGPSGCGKSTLLQIAGGLDRSHSGEVRLFDQSLAKMEDQALSRFRATKIGFVFQSFNLLSSFSALENVMLPGWFGEERRRDEKFALDALDQVGLKAKAHRRPGELSGGERQRVAMARALFSRPPLLLADEPTGNLDSRTGGELVDLLRRLHRDQGTTIVVVTHEERIAQAATRWLQLTDGRLEEAP